MKKQSSYSLFGLFALLFLQLDATAQVSAQFVGRYSIGNYSSGGGAAEISAYDPGSKRMFVINGPDSSLRIVNISNPALPVQISSISIKPYGIDLTSVACKNGLVAVSVIDSNGKTNPSSIVFMDINGNFISKVKVGANADNIVFTPDGTKLLVANEGEPNDGYTIDPEGSVSIINLTSGAASLTQANVQTAGFTAFNAPTVLDPKIRIYGKIQSGGVFLRNSTVAEDMEPEYITISDDGTTAWVTCQENNCVAVVNINTATITSLFPLGYKNYNLVGNGLDPSDRDGAGNTALANIVNLPVFGLFLPDGISSYKANGQTYFITANEGDARADWGAANNEEVRLNDASYILDTLKFGGAANVAALKANAALGRLNVTNRYGDFDNDGKFDSIFTFGGRGFSIWNGTTGAMVWDSKDEFERKTLAQFPANFNTGHTTNALDDRSDNKGPEPESVTVGKIKDSTYAFVALERIGGIMIYNITNPTAPYFVQYINSRNFSVTPSQANLANVGDLGPEGIVFIPAAESPNGQNLIMLSNEVSATVSFYNFGVPNASPSSSQTPYLTPAAPGVKLNSILTTGDAVNGYRMAGTPDGLGAFDNGNGTFTLLMNHEFGNTVGVTRAHGAKGAFVSKWTINKNTLAVESGSDLTKRVKLWSNGTYVTFDSANASALTAFNRFCSADLPAVSAFFNAKTGLGTQERIFMNGEESGAEGRAFGHIITGTEAGTTYELPALGKFSWENSVASPLAQNKTIVVGMDDATPGQIYVYVGTKTNTGTDIDKAGLTNGKLFGVAVTGLATEVSASVPAANTAFTMVDLGNVKDSTGASLNTRSNALGVTTFLRPEDGVWDPSNPNDFYFVTTNAFASPSRMWKLHFNDINNPEMGGTATAVLDGTEGQKMMDNIGIDKYGHILIQEDVGNKAHIGKIWQYTIATDQLVQIAAHDSSRFFAGGANFLTQDEEASGIIDMEDILGAGNFLLVDQAHYSIPGELVEGGQLLKLFNPATGNAANGALASSSQTPYLTPAAPGVKLNSILTVGDAANNSYKMSGLADGLGAYDNGNGTFTLLMNHEIGSSAGVIRDHGAKGAFVSKWVINKNDLSVVSGSDLIKRVNVYSNGAYTLLDSSNASSLSTFNRFCSADLPAVSAFFNAKTGLGTQERIFMNGEESGAEGRAFGHIITGPNAGTSYELAALGKFSWENSIASPVAQNKTIVVGLDDATPGQVYFYIGTKTNTGSDIDKAGLTNGKLFGVAVTGLATEVSASVPAANTAFTMVDLGNVKDSTGASLNTRSNALGVTTFLRPEDGAWDPSNPNDFYFVTTNAFASPSRMWKLHFNDINNPENGGTITAVLDGTEGQKMMDNLTIDNFGHVLIQEDPGNQVHLAKTWQYTIATDKLDLIASHDSTRFISGGANFLTQDEEASGIIDMENILGAGNFLLVDQAHYSIPGELVEGGQLLKLFNPATANGIPLKTINEARNINANDTVKVRGIVTRAWGRFIYIQDSTGAIGVRQSSGAMVDSITSGGIKEGDLVEVVGVRGNFNNYAQIAIATGTYKENTRVNVLARNQALPIAKLVTLKEINTNGEQYESQLVRVVGLKTVSTGNFAASTNYTIWDGNNPGDTMLLRVISAVDTEIDDAPGLAIPKGDFAFEGTIIQFCSTPTTGCTIGYQLQGLGKKEIIPQLTAFNILNPTTNTRIVTSASNNATVNFNWNKSLNATSHKWFVTTSTGSYNTPWAIGTQNSDTTYVYSYSQFDTIAATKGVAKGDSVLLKWTAYAYLGNDSVIASQSHNIWVVREATPLTLGAFSLVSPANNARIEVEQNSTAAININWNVSTNAVKYVWFATTTTGNFSAPLLRVPSNNNGNDNLLSLTSGAVDAILASMSVNLGDSAQLKWTVYAYKLNGDSLKASQDFNINLVRKRNLQPFGLISPENNTRLIVAKNETTPIVINWQASAAGANYKWILDKATGNFANPWVTLNSDNGGTANNLTLTSGAIDDVLALNAIAEGDSVSLKWTVRAYETNDSLQATQIFNLSVVRKKLVGLNEVNSNKFIQLYPNPTNGNSNLSFTLQNNEPMVITITDLQGKEVMNAINFDGVKGVNHLELPTAGFQNGMYFITISTNGKSDKHKLIVIH